MTTQERMDVQDLINRIDSAQVESTILAHNARRTLQNALTQLEDAREQTAAARAQVTQVTAECDEWRAEAIAMRDTMSYRRWKNIMVKAKVATAKSVPPTDNPNP